MKLIVKIKKAAKAIKDLVCPPATQDLELNTKNRNSAIKADHIQYGPMNLSDEKYWDKAAEHWNTTPDVAKKSRCGNCVAFDISPRMLDCLPGPVSEPIEDEDGKLGYCWMHHFKCHSARTCFTWAAGGPISEDKASEDWQKKSPFAEKDVLEEKRKKKKKKKKKKRDACYYKVKARYKVWPSAYASGALVKCRKNPKSWGKKSKKKKLDEKTDGKKSTDKNYTLRDWFDGDGWVQTGGKHDGKPCAKQPGQKTKPYCRDPDDRKAMSKKEREKRAAKKRKEDPNPNRKGKAKNVSQKKGK